MIVIIAWRQGGEDNDEMLILFLKKNYEHYLCVSSAFAFVDERLLAKKSNHHVFCSEEECS